MRYSARNVLKGIIINLERGIVNSELTLELPGGAQIISVITNDSVDILSLKVGKEAYAVIKASNVMIAVDD